MFYLLLFIILAVLLAMCADHFSMLVNEMMPSEDSCYTQLDSLCAQSAACNPDAKSRNSCCSRNPIIASQIREIERYAGKLCQSPDASGCVCLPNIGSIYVGSSIASTRSTEPYRHPEGQRSSALSNLPILTIEPTPVIPGLNWHFVGNGTVVVKLFKAAEISGVTVIHPPICQIPPGMEKSAPKNFQVFGLHDLKEKDPFSFGSFTYDVYKGQSAQTFPVQSCATDSFPLIEFRFTSNHGNPNYTALYKIQIHGDMSSSPTPPSDDDDEGDEE